VAHGQALIGIENNIQSSAKDAQLSVWFQGHRSYVNGDYRRTTFALNGRAGAPPTISFT